MSWWSYVERWKGDDTQDAVANAIGVKGSTVSRWRTGGADPKHVAAFARHYGRPVLEAFVEAGYLTEAEAKVRPSARRSLSSLPDAELLAEITRRLERARPSEVEQVVQRLVLDHQWPAGANETAGVQADLVLHDQDSGMTLVVEVKDSPATPERWAELRRQILAKSGGKNDIDVALRQALGELPDEIESLRVVGAGSVGSAVPVAVAARRTGTLTEDQRRRAVETARQVVDEDAADENRLSGDASA